MGGMGHRAWRNVGYSTEQSSDIIQGSFSCKLGFDEFDLEKSDCRKCFSNHNAECPGKGSATGNRPGLPGRLGHCLGLRGD